MPKEREPIESYEGQEQLPQEDPPLSPESQRLLYEMGKLIEAGDREGVQNFIHKIKIINRDTGNRKPEKQEGMLWDTVLEYVLTIFKFLLPEKFWLKWMIFLDGKFLISKVINKAWSQGKRLNVAGLYIFDLPEEKKGQVYIPPTKDGNPNFDKLVIMASDDCPVRAKRLLINHRKLTELKEKHKK